MCFKRKKKSKDVEELIPFYYIFKVTGEEVNEELLETLNNYDLQSLIATSKVNDTLKLLDICSDDRDVVISPTIDIMNEYEHFKLWADVHNIKEEDYLQSFLDEYVPTSDLYDEMYEKYKRYIVIEAKYSINDMANVLKLYTDALIINTQVS